MGGKLELTKSMILYKQIVMCRGDLKGIYIVSPNVRLERAKEKDFGRHLIEFSQLDIELREVSSDKFRLFMEDLIIYTFEFVKTRCNDELTKLEREIKIPKKPFKVYNSKEMKKEFGNDFEYVLSKKSTDLFRSFLFNLVFISTTP